MGTLGIAAHYSLDILVLRQRCHAHFDFTRLGVPLCGMIVDRV